MTQSLKNQILEEVRLRQYLPLDEIHALAAKGKYKQSTAEKKCRELCEEGYIQVLYNEKGYVRAYIPIYTSPEARNCDLSDLITKKVSNTVSNQIEAKQGVLL